MWIDAPTIEQTPVAVSPRKPSSRARAGREDTAAGDEGRCARQDPSGDGGKQSPARRGPQALDGRRSRAALFVRPNFPDRAVIAPGSALLLFALLVLAGAGVAWPVHGLAARLRRARRDARRIGIEDTLKYLFHRESEGLAVHADAIAGALGIRPAKARDLLDRLGAAGLVAPVGPTHTLTDRGRQEALRVVRTHRLLEQYLADRTGVEPEEWHALAEEAEHDLTPEEAEALAARLGQPRFDPHGEPHPHGRWHAPRHRDPSRRAAPGAYPRRHRAG